MSKSVPYKLSTTDDKFTSRSGLILISEVMRRMNVDNLANQYFPASGSNRGFSAATYIHVFVLMLLEGGRCLEDIRHLKAESDQLSMLGMKQLPGADALGNWLRRMGRSKAGLRRLEAINRYLLKEGLNHGPAGQALHNTPYWHKENRQQMPESAQLSRQQSFYIGIWVV